jgi:hypothetical protein
MEGLSGLWGNPTFPVGFSLFSLLTDPEPQHILQRSTSPESKWTEGQIMNCEEKKPNKTKQTLQELKDILEMYFTLRSQNSTFDFNQLRLDFMEFVKVCVATFGFVAACAAVLGMILWVFGLRWYLVP